MPRQPARLFLLLALLAAPALAQTQPPDLPPDLAPGIAATPRLTEGTKAAARINARLQQVDDLALGTVRACADMPENEYSRGVTLTLASPAYLSVFISEGGFCTGAAHPWFTSYPLTFDRLTGEEVDPLTWLPPSLSPGPEPQPYSEEADLARHAPLTDLYLSLLSPDPLIDCVQALRREAHSFDLWPDASSSRLLMQPSGLPYIDSYCIDTVALPLPLLQSLRFAPKLISALTRP